MSTIETRKAYRRLRSAATAAEDKGAFARAARLGLAAAAMWAIHIAGGNVSPVTAAAQLQEATALLEEGGAYDGSAVRS